MCNVEILRKVGKTKSTTKKEEENRKSNEWKDGIYESIGNILPLFPLIINLLNIYIYKYFKISWMLH